MKKVWVVVANSSEAKIYKANEEHQLVEQRILYHDESHLATNELVSDRQGRETNQFHPGSDTYQPKTSPKLKEALFFADTLAEVLHKGLQEGAFEALYIIAKPPFLGHLHQALHAHVTKAISGEVHKDLVHTSAKEIRNYLPSFL